MLSIPKALEEKNIYIPLREFISDVVMSRGNRRFLLTNLQAQIRGVTISFFDERVSGPQLSDVRMVIFELRFLP
jgi:hypothetical protein